MTRYAQGLDKFKHWVDLYAKTREWTYICTFRNRAEGRNAECSVYVSAMPAKFFQIRADDVLFSTGAGEVSDPSLEHISYGSMEEFVFKLACAYSGGMLLYSPRGDKIEPPEEKPEAAGSETVGWPITIECGVPGLCSEHKRVKALDYSHCVCAWKNWLKHDATVVVSGGS